ncbi:MAG: DUF6377 domain-containing protein [Rikenellaceae bacterium]
MRLKWLVLLFAVVFLSASTICNASSTEIIGNSLKEVLEQREELFLRQQKIIECEEQMLQLATTPREQFDISYRIFNLSRSFKFDIAHQYSTEAMRLANVVGDRSLICRAKAAQISTLTSGGLFVEAVDIVNNCNLSGVNLDVRREFYYNVIRLYSDLMNYAEGSEFYEIYRAELLRYANLLLKSSTNDDFYRAYAGGYLYRVRGEYLDMVELLQRFYVEKRDSISAHHASIITFMLANAYFALDEQDCGAEVMLWSVAHDTEAAARENRSIKHLAEHLFVLGDVELADELLGIALEDARFYNARHRNLEINSLLPLVNERKMEIVSRQRRLLNIFVVVISVVGFVALVMAIVAILVARKMAAVKCIVEEQVVALELLNGRLAEANDAKEFYIIEALRKRSCTIRQVETLLKRIDVRVKSKQFDDLKYIYRDFNVKQERAEFYREFDAAFLKLFPNFIAQFNALLSRDNQITVESGDAVGLPMELRIFALMRLGVSDTEEVARFFDLSVNTIYTYKAKVKSRAVVDREDFEARVMAIELIDNDF